MISASMDECWRSPFHHTGRASVLHVDVTPGKASEGLAGSWLDRQEVERRSRYRLQRENSLYRAALRAIF